jgi:uncharacterized protein YdbL (DUF1318 family)
MDSTMANSNYNYRLNVAGPNPVVTGNKRLTLRNVIKQISGFLNGQRLSSGGSATLEVGTAAATGTVTISSGSGAVGATINGTLVTVTWATSDTASAAALAVAINAAAAIVSSHVTATSAAGVVTLTSKFPGPAGNAVTLALSGTGVTVSGARLAGGTSTSFTF